jgi:hypothetical protein
MIAVPSRQAATANSPGPTLAMLRARKADIVRVAAEHGASNVRVFGSVALRTAGQASDVDLLVTSSRDSRSSIRLHCGGTANRSWDDPSTSSALAN